VIDIYISTTIDRTRYTNIEFVCNPQRVYVEQAFRHLVCICLCKMVIDISMQVFATRSGKTSKASKVRLVIRDNYDDYNVVM
jgi:hypothetical protein